jgi:hypothetical protein
VLKGGIHPGNANKNSTAAALLQHLQRNSAGSLRGSEIRGSAGLCCSHAHC